MAHVGMSEDPDLREEHVKGQNGLQDRDGETEMETGSPRSPSGEGTEKAVVGAGKEEEKKKPSKIATMWKKIGLDAPTIIMMFK